jgi:hypothetical protein
MNLQEFCKEVNRLARLEAGYINGQDNIFSAVHHDYPELMLKHYFDRGTSPREVLTELEDEAILEAKWEARVS